MGPDLITDSYITYPERISDELLVWQDAEDPAKILFATDRISDPGLTIWDPDGDWFEFHQPLYRYLNKYTSDKPEYKNQSKGWAYVDGCISDDIRVYVDKTMFGKQAGEDISDHLIVEKVGKYSGLRCSYPDFKVLEENRDGMYLKDMFTPGSAMYADNLCIATITFDEIPGDMPDNFTLSLEIPVEMSTEWPTYSFMVASKDFKPSEKFRTMHGTCEINLMR